MPAWAVNQLYRHHRIVFDRLLDAGERFRNAQTSQLAGKSADIRAPLEARRAALSELAGHAARILSDAGSAAAPDTMRRVTTTLEALSTYARIPDTPQADASSTTCSRPDSKRWRRWCRASISPAG